MLDEMARSDLESFRRSQRLEVAPEITTNRLRLRAWRSEDLDPLVRMYTDEEIMRHLGGPQTREEIEAFFPVRIERWRTQGWGAWAMELKETPGIIGVLGYGPPKAPFEEREGFLDFGWLLDKDCWGKGFATEAAQAALTWGFEDRHIVCVLATPDASNQGSRHVCEKLNMRPITTVDPIVVYSIDHHQWIAQPRG